MTLTAQERHDMSLMTPKEVAALFRVDPKTVTRWRAAGRINGVRTPGGHIRFTRKEVRMRFDQMFTERVVDDREAGDAG